MISLREVSVFSFVLSVGTGIFLVPKTSWRIPPTHKSNNGRRSIVTKFSVIHYSPVLKKPPSVTHRSTPTVNIYGSWPWLPCGVLSSSVVKSLIRDLVVGVIVDLTHFLHLIPRDKVWLTWSLNTRPGSLHTKFSERTTKTLYDFKFLVTVSQFEGPEPQFVEGEIRNETVILIHWNLFKDLKLEKTIRPFTSIIKR